MTPVISFLVLYLQTDLLLMDIRLLQCTFDLHLYYCITIGLFIMSYVLIFLNFRLLV